MRFAEVQVRKIVAVRRALDPLREHGRERNLLAAVMRILRDCALLDGEGVREGSQTLPRGALFR
jgi:hypothetical protein